MLTLHKLDIFMRVVECGSFSRAANDLFMTQSAISQHIRDLEDGLGTDLFERGRRGVTPTAAGKRLAQYAQQILHLVAEAEATVTNVEGLGSGQLRIGTTPGSGAYLLPDWTQSWQRLYPQLTVALHTVITPEALTGVRTGRFDLAIVEGEIADATPFTITVLQTIDLVVVVGPDHRWWGQDAIELRALQDEPLITRQLSSQTRAWIENLMTEHAIQPRIVAEFDSPESIKRATSSGLGVAIQPDYVVNYEREAGTLWSLRVADVVLQRALKLVMRADKPLTPIAQAFVTHLSDPGPA